MKKFFKAGILTVFCLLFIQPVFSAEVLKVEALSSFSTAQPPEFISLKAMSSVMLDENVTIPEGVIVKCRITDVKAPKRLKRNATFSAIPVSYIDEQGNEVKITEEYIGKFSPKFEIDKGEVAKNAALTVGDHFVKGVSLGYHAVEGAVKNEEGNRFKSSAVSIYENSIFSYLSKGSELEIREHDLFSLRFKDYDGDEDEPGEDVQSAATEGANESKTLEPQKTQAVEIKLNNNKRGKGKNIKKDKKEIKSSIKETKTDEHVVPAEETSAAEAMPDNLPAENMPQTNLKNSNEPEVHWVQEGIKGETLKFGKEE